MNLPNIYQNKDLIKSNNQTEYIINTRETKSLNVKEDLNSILKNISTFNKINVQITLKNKEILNKTIIGKTSKYLITLDNKLISINTIESITKK